MHHVIRKVEADWFSSVPIVMSMAGIRITAANGTKIKNHGKGNVPGSIETNDEFKMNVEVTDAKRLASVPKIV